MVGIYGVGKPVNTPIIGDVVPGHPAADAGLKADDMVLSLNGTPIETWEQLSTTIRGSGGKPVEMLVERTTDKGVEKVTLTVIPEADRSGLVSDEERSTGDVYRVGILPSMEKKPVAFTEALLAGPRITWNLTTQTLIGLKGMILGHISSDNIAGPVRIFQEAGRSAQKGFEYVLSFMIFLNVSLAVLNLLPIPVLDGGHLFFFTIEALKGSPINIRVREISTQVGMFLLLALMVFALGNDLFR
jgi:regulator of sigma E protease